MSTQGPSGRLTPIRIDQFITPGHTNCCGALALTYGGLRAAKPQRRSWRCTLRRHHSGPHASRGGHRSWESLLMISTPFVEQWPELAQAALVVCITAKGR